MADNRGLLSDELVVRLQASVFQLVSSRLPGVACLVLVLALEAATALEADLAALREWAMRDVFVLKDYLPGKNSFVESPERHVGAWTGVGFRRTLLDVKGQGSIRHLWTTCGEGPPFLEWEFYVDGETAPSIRGTDVELVQAAANFQPPFTGLIAPAVPVSKRDYNLFLPIPFDRSIRVDVVQRLPTFWLWFCQLDYRLQDASLAGARLLSRREGTNLVFEARNWPKPGAVSVGERRNVDFDEATVEPGSAWGVDFDHGPGVVRRLTIECSRPDQARLQIRFDGASTPAVNSPVGRFFGPFRGVSFERQSPTRFACHLPMPYQRGVKVLLINEGAERIEARVSAQVEKVPKFGANWGYFHARHQRTEHTDGHRLHQVLYVRGRGNWLGMTLYKTGHDHGGGDFAIVDGEGENPAFLHGVNGEDYFTFAWFGRGTHHPYAIAHSNDEGRYRHHFENPYPFKKSLSLEWGAYPDLSPESVAVWYQDTAEDTTVPDGARGESVEWDVFGPVPVPYDAQGNPQANWTSVLPAVAELDAGRRFECRLVQEKFESGWMKEWSVGPSLNLTYIGRHGTKIKGEVELGGMGHAYLARRFVEADHDALIAYVFSHDDPVKLLVNGQVVYRGGTGANGFESHTIQLPLKRGRNEVLVKLMNRFNQDFNWTGFLLRPKDGAGAGGFSLRDPIKLQPRSNLSANPVDSAASKSSPPSRSR